MTPVSATDLRRLHDEVALATFPDGGLLLHLVSGDIFELDASGAAIWGALSQAKHLDDAVASLQSTLGLTPDEARLSVETAVHQGLALAIGRTPPPGIYRMHDDGGSISLCRGERPLLVFHRRELTLTLLHRSDPSRPQEEDDVPALVRLFIPKILTAWFPLAMHASALEIGGQALLFSGGSGSGKTTTARTLALESERTRVLSEDVVLLQAVGGAGMIVGGAEPIIHAWIDSTSQALIEARAPIAGVENLVVALRQQAPLIPLRKIVFLDASRRQGRSWSLRALGPAQALRAFFLNSFLPSATPATLRRHLLACQAIASTSSAWEAVAIPDNLQDLRRSSQAQREMIAS